MVKAPTISNHRTLRPGRGIIAPVIENPFDAACLGHCQVFGKVFYILPGGIVSRMRTKVHSRGCAKVALGHPDRHAAIALFKHGLVSLKDFCQLTVATVFVYMC